MRIFLFSLLTSAAIASTRTWVPNLGDRDSSACFNAYTQNTENPVESLGKSGAVGGTMLAQCGGPTTTQIARGGSTLIFIAK